MESLNDDCLFKIFEGLQFDDQISLFIAVPTFQGILKYWWSRRYNRLHIKNEQNSPPSRPSETLVSLQFDSSQQKEEKSLSFEKLDILLANISDTILMIEIEYLTEDIWTLIKKYNYPNGEDFCVYEWNELIGDEYIIKISQMFPNLQCLYLSGILPNLHIEKFKQLLHIYFADCCITPLNVIKMFENSQNLIYIMLGRIMEQVPCDNAKAFENFCKLERFKVHSINMAWLKELDKLTHIEEIVVDETTDNENQKLFYENLCQYKQKELTFLQISGEVPFLQIPGKAMFENLEKIVIQGNYMDDFIYVAECVPCLRQLVFNKCCTGSESILEDLLNNCDLCEFISIQNCTFFDLVNLTVNIGKLTWQRSKPLKFNFWNNEETTLTIEGFSLLLKVTSTDEISVEVPAIHAKFEPQCSCSKCLLKLDLTPS